MRKASISITYDEDKLSALKLYLEQRGTQLETELANALDALYTKTVPAGVRAYIGMRSGMDEPVPKTRRSRIAREPDTAVEVTENE
ncbi:DUF6103 family protein [Intestinimonas massiliensis]|uniref:DUF6103 family protein n=1 Tax=Intestinimonas massiliensis (ex Afouda et al. 2020) TaxID=1673721 RepID=A0AAW5JKD2_9FIRM|nr:DUF6103 family protein [Intestinimonas massiliensis (ex Afouda et al. 2020)]MCQ4770297.1 DUF6103 family protein [Intestinimonas massiliensis (ex Afouda et al. 2020)]